MTLVLELSPNQHRELEILAEREGLPPEEYALRHLFPTTAVEGTIPFDLSPVVLDSFDDPESGLTLRFRDPLSVQPTLDESKQLILLDYDPLNIHLHAFSRDELEDSLCGLIWVLWDDYAKAPETTLNSAAREFKIRLLNAIEETPLAAR